tara:strand:+ start:3248 stop:3376 length:129 start_codon:yes stop_codon:yes gene_type:complete
MNYKVSHQTKDTLIQEYLFRIEALTKRVEALENYIIKNKTNL